MKLLLAAALLTLPGPALAAKDDTFCRDVRRLAQGAQETPAFRSLRAEHFEPRLLVHSCFFSDAGSYTCSQSLAPPGLTRESVAQRIHACLPGATLATRRDYPDIVRIVRRGRFVARIVEHGAPRAHVGRIINIYIAAEPAAAGANPR